MTILADIQQFSPTIRPIPVVFSHCQIILSSKEILIIFRKTMMFTFFRQWQQHFFSYYCNKCCFLFHTNSQLFNLQPRIHVVNMLRNQWIRMKRTLSLMPQPQITNCHRTASLILASLAEGQRAIVIAL